MADPSNASEVQTTSPVIPIVLVAASFVAVSAFPVKGPTKASDVIEVAPVITPASILIVLSSTICCPARGVINKSVPAVDEIVFPLILTLSTFNSVNVPTLVKEEPTTVLPNVVLLSTDCGSPLPSSILNSLPFAITICSLNSQASVSFSNKIVLSDAPFNVIPPPSAVTSVGASTDPSSIFLSSTVIIVELIVDVVP